MIKCGVKKNAGVLNAKIILKCIYMPKKQVCMDFQQSDYLSFSEYEIGHFFFFFFFPVFPIV